MALTGGVQVEGLREVVRALEALGVEVDDLKDAFADIAAEGARLASSFAPHRSGRLAASIRGNRAKGKAVVTAGRASVQYSGPINYGWPARHIAAAGFMQRADQELSPVAVQKLERALTDAIREAGLT